MVFMIAQKQFHPIFDASHNWQTTRNKIGVVGSSVIGIALIALAAVSLGGVAPVAGGLGSVVAGLAGLKAIVYFSGKQRKLPGGLKEGLEAALLVILGIAASTGKLSLGGLSGGVMGILVGGTALYYMGPAIISKCAASGAVIYLGRKQGTKAEPQQPTASAGNEVVAGAGEPQAPSVQPKDEFDWLDD